MQYFWKYWAIEYIGICESLKSKLMDFPNVFTFSSKFHNQFIYFLLAIPQLFPTLHGNNLVA